MHINRKNIGNFWPIPRKGTKYIAVSSHNKKNSIPLSIVVRDILKLVKNVRELKKILNEKKIKINGKIIRDVRYPVGLFDLISIHEENYKCNFNGKKFFFEKTENVNTKVIKVIGKKNLGKNKIQINLMDGRNIFNNEKVSVNDSILYDFKLNKVLKVIKMEKGRTGFVVKGKHSGIKGKILEILKVGGKKMAIIDNKGAITVWIKNMIVVE